MLNGILTGESGRGAVGLECSGLDASYAREGPCKSKCCCQRYRLAQLRIACPRAATRGAVGGTAIKCERHVGICHDFGRPKHAFRSVPRTAQMSHLTKYLTLVCLPVGIRPQLLYFEFNELADDLNDWRVGTNRMTAAGVEC